MSDSRLEMMYTKLPVFLQNIAVSIKGLMLRNIRKRGQYKNQKKDVIERCNWDAEQIQVYQLKQYNDLLEYARNYVPYYREVFKETNFSPNSIFTYSDIQKLPILNRDTVKNNPSAFISDAISSDQCVSLHTTGTTGSPLRIKSDIYARQKNYAFFDGYLQSIGLNPDSKHIVIGGRIIVPQTTSTPPFWRYSFFQKSLLMSSYHLSDKFMDYYIDKIESFAPEYIESYPSSIYTLARHVLKKGRRLKCKAIVTSAETLFPEQREIIERAFNTTVYDQYGCAEMSFFVAQCNQGKYHVRSDYGLLELVDDSGRPVPNGQLGRVICTGFINKVMPLIRYSIGDMAIFSEENVCGCGLNTPILKEIQGRMDDVLIKACGQSVGRMSPVLKGLPVQESQYIQYTPGEVELLIVPDSNFSKDRDIAKIKDAVQARLGKDFKVIIQLVGHIKRGKGGKLKSVISHINNN